MRTWTKNAFSLTNETGIKQILYLSIQIRMHVNMSLNSNLNFFLQYHVMHFIGTFNFFSIQTNLLWKIKIFFSSNSNISTTDNKREIHIIYEEFTVACRHRQLHLSL